ncbi:3-hydroxyisobutyrate dehydrogenase [uncultured Slackia sp.]|uniref:3-hydroxyisobutyrate dehydrogenase n=1 Tax=uncultured Slackia sp. TaxID=665903 RepID=UPI0026DBBB73|nr:3-hydroxyisobutyrate dehydrogenase [uncultured Slackia sp.]
MEKELFDYVAERAEVLATNDASTQVTKDAAAAWEAAVAADASDEAVAAATDKLLDVLEGRPTTIDGVIAFAEGPAKQLMGEEVAAAMLAKQLMGEEVAAAMLAEQLKRKEAGAKYCNCPSCTAASELLAKFGRIEL